MSGVTFMLQYTICFIKNGDNILLLNRNKSPNMGVGIVLAEKSKLAKHIYNQLFVKHMKKPPY